MSRGRDSRGRVCWSALSRNFAAKGNRGAMLILRTYWWVLLLAVPAWPGRIHLHGQMAGLMAESLSAGAEVGIICLVK